MSVSRSSGGGEPSDKTNSNGRKVVSENKCLLGEWYRTLLKVLLGPMSENGRRWNRRQTRERRRASASLLSSERSERVPVWSAEVLDRSRRQTYKGLA